MLGHIHLTLEKFIASAYGNEALRRIMERAGLLGGDPGLDGALLGTLWVKTCPYADETVYRWACSVVACVRAAARARTHARTHTHMHSAAAQLCEWVLFAHIGWDTIHVGRPGCCFPLSTGAAL